MRLSSYFLLLISSVLTLNGEPSSSISLDGEWRFQLDPMDLGVRDRWFERELEDKVKLPGTTDLNGKGFALNPKSMSYLMENSGRATEVQVLRTQWPGTQLASRADETGHLARRWFYVGKAWYQRNFEIPEGWSNKRIQLRLERVLWQSNVWIDEREVGQYDSLVTEHVYELGELAPGIHRLTIQVDNSLVHNIGILGHSYGPETQTRWNGIVGAIELKVTPQVALGGLQVFPSADRKRVRFNFNARNDSGRTQESKLSFELRDEVGRAIGSRSETTVRLAAGKTALENEVSVQQDVQSWDEFNPIRYELIVRIETQESSHQASSKFGFREIKRNNRTILLNGRPIFLRGTIDCAVYPKTGHPPMTVGEWLKVLGTAKDYGFNHVRFHTWCPPEAAFEAADRLGLYLAPETPFWVDNWTVATSSYPKLLGSDDDVVRYVKAEFKRISEKYGNHPSFAFFCIGNEFGNSSDWNLVERMLAELKEYDPRRLYNATTARKTVASDDFWVTHHTGSARTRGIGPPHTNWNFSEAIESKQLPIIVHETGQRPVFPDFDQLLPKFTGPLRPYNFERLQKLLKPSRLASQVRNFTEASGRFQYVQYKAEHEAMHRTPGLAGYQLLMLTDFTGQSEALVGILDPFWEEKGIIRRDEIRQWNSPTVLLAGFARYLWSPGEKFSAEVSISHFGAAALKNLEIKWSIRTEIGLEIGKGRFGPVDVPVGGLTQCGSLNVLLNEIDVPQAATLELTARGIVNRWPLWIYPPVRQTAADQVLVFDQTSDDFQDAVAEGQTILFLAHGLKNSKAASTRFESVYWSAGWWGNDFSSLGIVCDPKHPALAGFPNAGHSDWQWHELTRNATTILLDEMPPGFRPIVQAVPDFHYNKLLGQLFEIRVGSSRIMVCGYDLKTDLTRRSAARTLMNSLLQYMESERFQPQHGLSMDQVGQLLSPQKLEPDPE